MSSLRLFTAAALLAALAVQPLCAEEKAAPEKKFSKAEIEAFLTKCSVEADEKGLTKAKNKLAERKSFRRECMSKFGVEPKAAKSE